MGGNSENRVKAVTLAAKVSLGSTALIVCAKLAAAALTHSVSILAESFNSLIDVVMSIMAIATISLAARPADEDHPYGHGRLEVITSSLQMFIIIIGSGIIAWQASQRIAHPQDVHADVGIAVMAAAIVANILVITYLKRAATKHGSASLDAESEHLRSDTLASIGIVVGLVATKITGLSILDPIFAMSFTLLGAVFAVRELTRLIHQLMDGALPPAEIAKVKVVLDTHPQVLGYHKLRTRRTGELRLIDLHVLLDDHLSFVEAHDMAEDVESSLSEALGGAVVTVHYEPFHAEMAHQAAHHESAT